MGAQANEKYVQKNNVNKILLNYLAAFRNKYKTTFGKDYSNNDHALDDTISFGSYKNIKINSDFKRNFLEWLGNNFKYDGGLYYYK